MIILKETVYKDDGTTEVTESKFRSKALLIKKFKSRIGVPGHFFYDLWKKNKVLGFEYGGVKRDWEIKTAEQVKSE